MCMYVGYTAWYGIYERGNHQDLEPGITYAVEEYTPAGEGGGSTYIPN